MEDMRAAVFCVCTVASENIHENNLESRGDVHSQTPQYMAKVRCQRRAPSLLWYQNCHPPFSLTHWAIIIPQWLFGCRIPPPALGLALAGCSLVHPPMAFSPALPPGNALLFVFFLSFSTSSQCLQQTHRLVFFSGFRSSNCVANTKLGFQILSDQDLRFPKA